MLENDDAFDAMAGLRRRKVLVGLLEYEPQHVAGLSDDARELTEANDSFLASFLAGPLEMDGVEKATVRLHHVDLPKLTDLGFVEWSPGDDEVTRGPRFDELRPLLELLVDLERDAETPDVDVAVMPR